MNDEEKKKFCQNLDLSFHRLSLSHGHFSKVIDSLLENDSRWAWIKVSIQNDYSSLKRKLDYVERYTRDLRK